MGELIFKGKSSYWRLGLLRWRAPWEEVENWRSREKERLVLGIEIA